jgi:voltage-gated potassium channel Kch
VAFATDFASLHYFASENFKTVIPVESSGIMIFFEYLYFSTITFSSVGYGDIVPTSILSKILVMLEVALRFFVLVFGIANINQIRINDNHTD